MGESEEVEDGHGYHYTESGFDNVWLANGFTLDNHPNYGVLVWVEDAVGLETLIHRWLVDDPEARVGGWRMEYEKGRWRAWRQLTSEEAKLLTDETDDARLDAMTDEDIDKQIAEDELEWDND
jgi:hypothetical protein